MILFPADQRTTVGPSGCLSSEQERPRTSKAEGILILTRARWIRLLITACLTSLLKLHLQYNSSVPRLLSKEPQGQTWGSQKLAPSLRFIAILTASSSRRYPQDNIGNTCNYSPLCGAAAVSKQAWLCLFGWEANRVANKNSTNDASQEHWLQKAIQTGSGVGWNDVSTCLADHQEVLNRYEANHSATVQL